jgi:2-isopropylmalate synthase
MEYKRDVYVSGMMEEIRSSLMLPEKAYFFDTTLRDGEQTPGISFTLDEKIKISCSLNEMGIDVIEAGFPIISKGDFEACKQIAKLGLDSQIIGLARLKKEDINKVLEADLDSIHLFIATSELHIKEKLRMTSEEIIQNIMEMITYAKDHFSSIVFSAEDATRTDLNFLIRVNQLAVNQGATVINIPDTVGTISPVAYGYIIRKNRESLPNNIRIAVHCHNDFGLAVANTLAGFENGASEAQTTILGLGERAGNASFEQSAMALYSFYRIPMNINTKKIFTTAKLVESFCGGKVTISRLTPLIGQNAFSHESGIHTHAILRNARTYEPITPELIGIPRSDDLSQIIKQSIKFGKHTGGYALKVKLSDMGIAPSDEQFNKIISHIKNFGDKGHEISEEDFLAILKDVLDTIPEEEQLVILEELTVLTGSVTPTATVKLKIKSNGKIIEKIGTSIGVGPVDASVNAIIQCFEPMSRVKLLNYKIDAITGGTDALGHVTTEVMDIESNHIVKTNATHEDIVMSSVLSLLKALNIIAKKKNLNQ